MSALDRVVGGSARLAVALWIGFALALGAAPDPGQPRLAELTARVRPLVEAAVKGPGSKPIPVHVGAAEIHEGQRLLDDAGHFPVLTCSYEDFDSFRSYARAMTSLGARFVVVRQRAIAGELSLETGGLTDTRPGPDFSPRARDYTGEPDLADLAAAAREHFGPGSEIMMLVPRSLDAGLFGGIARALARSGKAHGEFREIRGRYERSPGGGVHLRVDAGVRPDGAEVVLDLLFDLGQISSKAQERSQET
jgi:hypothetical protein